MKSALLKRIMLVFACIFLMPVSMMADGPDEKIVRSQDIGYQYTVFGVNIYLGEDYDHRDEGSCDGVSLYSRNDLLKISIDGKFVAYVDDLIYDSPNFNQGYVGNKWGDDRYRIIGYWSSQGRYLDQIVTPEGNVVSVGHINHARGTDGSHNHEYWVYIDVYLKNNYVGQTHKVVFEGGWRNNGGAASHVVFSHDVKSGTDFNLPENVSFKRRPDGTIAYDFAKVPAIPMTGRLNGKSMTDNVIIYNADHRSDETKGILPESGNDVITDDVVSRKSLSTDSKMEGTSSKNSSKMLDPTKSHTLYARFFHEVQTYTNGDFGSGNEGKIDARFIKDYEPVIVNCMPKAANLREEYDPWTKKVRLTWNTSVSDKEHVSRDGKWFIFRSHMENGQRKYERLGTVDHLSNTDETYKYKFTCEETPYGGDYTFHVAYVWNEWGDVSEPPYMLDTNVKIDTRRKFYVSPKAESRESSIYLSWTHPAIANASINNPYTFSIKRLLEGDGQKWEVIREHVVSNSSTVNGSYEDKEIADHRCQKAIYKMEFEALDSTYSINMTPNGGITITGKTSIQEFNSTRGDLSSTVKLTWKVKQVGNLTSYYDLYRRPLGTDDEWNFIYRTEGTASIYTYDDMAQPGNYYEYGLVLSSPCSEDDKEHYEVTTAHTDGFALSFGTVNGRIYYGSGTAVDSVKVMLVSNGDNTDTDSLFHSLSAGTRGANHSIAWLPKNTNAVKDLLGTKSWTLQTFIKPSDPEYNATESESNDPESNEFKTLTVGEVGGAVRLALEISSVKGLYTPIIYIGNEKHVADEIYVAGGTWQNLAWGIDPVKKTWTVIHKGENDFISSQSGQFNASATYEITKNSIVLANNAEENADDSFKGGIDEIRLFTGVVLTTADVMRNYDHRLSGAEKNLAIYWHLDEGLQRQAMAYDYSKTSGIRNNRHAVIKGLTTSYDVPSSSLFSLCAYTDKDGNYSVNGVPFSGDGRSYSIVPVMGIHEFSPSSVNRYVSSNALVHNGVDFKDVSSFKVSGSVRYENTNVPVTNALISVDGLLASRDGEAVRTDVNGEFVVDVPIGDHFISVDVKGHTFVNNGRYPADKDGVGTRHTFDREIHGLSFVDNTLVTITGRVVGGNVEAAKPYGFGVSNANIGQATIKMKIANDDTHFLNVVEKRDGNTVEYVPSKEILKYEKASSSVESSATVGCEDDKGNPEQAKVITIVTDPKSGEFTAKVPPLKYHVSSVKTKSCDFDGYSFSEIDGTNVLLARTDSFETKKGEKKYFDYHASFSQVYHAPRELYVEQLRNDTLKIPWDGHFGDSIFVHKTYPEGATEKTKPILENVPLYSVNKDTKKVTYLVNDVPFFTQLGEYKFKFKEYEVYINKDEDITPSLSNPEKWQIENLAIAGDTVKVRNQFAMSTAVDKDNNDKVYVDESDGKVVLDANGEGVYAFIAGLPKIIGDYRRQISITYGENLAWKQDNMLTNAIVLGNMPQGNDFITGGPDELTMILRDPPGSWSNATWQKDHVVANHTTYDNRFVDSFGNHTEFHSGVALKTVKGVGLAIFNELEVRSEHNVDLNISGTVGTQGSTITTTSTTDNYSTMFADPRYDGASGDVFIGVGTNTIIGEAIDVSIHKGGDGKWCAFDQKVKTSGKKFKTTFAYTQYHIENFLLNTFREDRNKFLEYEGHEPEYRDPKGTRYISLVPPTDPNFGASTKYYKVEYPKNVSACDTISYYNSQINRWVDYLRYNEKVKADAIRGVNSKGKNIKPKNYSFDAGSGIARFISESTENDWSTVGSFNYTMGYSYVAGGIVDNAIGVINVIGNMAGYAGNYVSGKDSTDVYSFGYNLFEDGEDYITVDVYEKADVYGPVFVTRAGATSCPYEDEVKSKYLDEEVVLMAKTIPMEQPKIQVTTPVVTGVPSGQAAILTVKISNISPSTQGKTFGISLTEESNPDGLQLYMDGAQVVSGRNLYIPANQEVTKTIEVRQTKKSVTDYTNLQLSFASDCDPNVFDVATFDVHFLPEGTTVDIASTTDLVNSNTQDDLKIELYNYDLNATQLDRIELQYRKGNGDWGLFKSYVKAGDPRLVSDPDNFAELIPLEGTKRLSVTVNMHDGTFTDGTYEFRAQTVCNVAGKELRTDSKVLTVVLDLTAPKPLGYPSPAGGVLKAGDEISITFNEDIRSEALVKGTNITVTGVLNESKLSHDVAMALTSQGTAKTETSINLSERDFTLGAWIYAENKGVILSHGSSSDGLRLSLDDNGYLDATIGEKSLKSKDKLPLNKWIYIGIAMDNVQKALSMNVNYDATTLESRITEVDSYLGNGAFSVGGGFTGRIHDVTLWNKTMLTAEQKMTNDVVKSRYTPNLIGYWPMSEGHGTTAADICRGRHLVLGSASAWGMGTDNYHVALDGTKIVRMPLNASLGNTESYLLEEWFLADKSNNAKASLLAFSSGALDIALDASGKMSVTTAMEKEKEIGSRDWRDGQWHHLAVNARLSSGGVTTIYVDGEPLQTLAAVSTPAFQTQQLWAGGKVKDNVCINTLKGGIDEVRLWKGQRTADVVKSEAYSRQRTEAEDELVLYYPFETTSLDEGKQIVMGASVADASKNASGLKLLDETVVITRNGSVGMKAAPEKENVDFSFVANERKIVISPDIQPQRIEGCTLTFKVSHVTDINKNYAEPVVWSAFVQQNQLLWKESEVKARKEGTSDATFSCTIVNKGGTRQDWALIGLPHWLSTSMSSGSIEPLSEVTVDFTVNGGTAVGKYEAVVYLTGQMNIGEPLFISLISAGETPDWSVDPHGYESTMNVIGKVRIDDVFSTDEDDIIGVFLGKECRGVAHPQYMSRDDAYYLMINIYGNPIDDGDPLTYKVYDASTGIIYPTVRVAEKDKDVLTFTADGVMGTIKDPVIFNPTDEIEQKIDISEGWNWISFNVKPKDSTVKAFLKEYLKNFNVIKSAKGLYSNVTGMGDLISIENTDMYKVQSNITEEMVFVGSPAKPSAEQITIQKKGWSWIGYPADFMSSVTDALAGVSPVEGDVVKSQTQFSMYTDGAWMGTLQVIQPNLGYLYSSEDDFDKSFFYPSVKPSSEKAPRKALASSGHGIADSEPLPLATEYNMSVVALVKDGEQIISDATIMVYDSHGNLCGYSDATVDDHLHFLTIGGNEPGERFTVRLKATGYDEVTLSHPVVFSPDAVVGSPKAPVILLMDGTTGISVHETDAMDGDIYNLQGVRFSKKPQQHGVYIVGRKKKVVK